jgi:WD40 repeat protein
MSVTFDSTGTQLFAGGNGEGVGHWEVGPGPTECFVQLIPAAGTTMSVAISDGGLIATSALDGAVVLRSTDDPSRATWSIKASADRPASAVALSADGSMLVAGFRNGVVRVWYVHSPTELEEVVLSSAPFATWVNSVAISNDDPLIAAASSDGNVRLWNTTTWHEVRPDLRHPTVVTSVKFAPGHTLLTTAEDGAARTWVLDESAGGNSNDTIWSLTMETSGQHMLAGSRHRTVLYDILEDERSTTTRELPSPDDIILSGASALSPDGSLFVCGTRQGPLTLARLTDIDAPTARLNALDGLVEHVAFSTDGTVLGAVDNAGTAQLWTIDSSGQASCAGNIKVEPPALGIAFSSDGSLLAVSSESGNVHLYDIIDPSAPRAVAVIKAGDSFAISVAFHPLMPVLAAGNADRSVSLWDCSSLDPPRLLQRLTGPGGHVMALAFNRSGSRLAAGLTDGNVWIWNTERIDDALVHARVPTGGGGAYAVAFSPDGRHLFGAGPQHRINRWILDEADAITAIRTAAGDPITAQEWSTLIPTLPYAPPG